MKLLQDIKVLDLSRVLAGPWATQLLADYGAEVWKIEKPKAGDDTRSWGPPFIEAKQEKLSAYFMATNRGKYSLTIDITQTEGQTLIKELVKKADILVENFKVGGLKKYGLDYASLQKINSSLIYCSITGFGQTGPAADQAGYDAIIQAKAGLMSITGEPEDDQASQKNSSEPQKVGVAVADLMTGMYATTAILAALNARNSSGQGQHIDLALFDTQLAMLANQGMNYLVSGQVPQRRGNSHPNIVPYQTFKCADGFIMLAVGNDGQFQSLCKIIECPEMAEDTKFINNAARVEHRDELVTKLAAILIKEKQSFWLKKCQQVNIPCSAVNNIADAFAEPQSKHRDTIRKIDSETFGEIPQIANPVKFSQSQVQYKLPPPMLGQDTEVILKKVLLLDEEQIQQLKASHII